MNQSDRNNQNNKVSDIDTMMEEIQKQIVEDEKTIYSNKVIELYTTALNFGMMEDADVFAAIKGWCGDTMVMYLRVKEGKIEESSFYTDGCGATLAAGSMLTIMAKGKSLEEARNITEEDLLDALDGLPDEHQHCAALSVNTLRKAISDFFKDGGPTILENKEVAKQINLEKRDEP
jgi:nitrogen fixation protein NifU and related proteins